MGDFERQSTYGQLLTAAALRLALGAPLLASAAAHAQVLVEPPQLRVSGDRADLSYAFGRTAVVRLTAAEGMLVRLTVLYRSLDPDIVAVDSRGATLATRTATTVANGIEPLTFVASDAGGVEVRITGSPESSVVGRATVTLIEIRAVTGVDARRIGAEAELDAGHALYGQGGHDSFVAAAAKYSEAALGWEALGDREWRARALERRGAALIQSNEFAGAQAALDDALTYFERADDAVGVAIVLTNRCDLHLRAGNLPAGLADGIRAIDVAKRADVPWVELGAANNVGGAYFRRGDYSTAVPYAKRGVELARALELTGDLPQFLTNLSVLYRQLGRYGVALQYARQAYELLQGPERPPGGAFNARTTGELSRLLGRFDAAERYFTRALSLAETEGDARDQAFTHGMMAALWFDREDYGRARGHLETSERLWPPSSTDPGFSLDLAFVQVRVGDLDGAASRFTRAQTTFDSRGARDARPARGLGLIALQRGDTTGAIAHFRRALESAVASEAQQVESTLRYDLGLALRAAGRLEEAGTELEASIALDETARAGVAAERLRIGYLERSRAKYAALLDLRMQQAGDGQAPAAVAAAFVAAERGRARALLDRLRGTGVGMSALDADAAERPARLERELDLITDEVARTRDTAVRRRLLAEWDARIADYDMAQGAVDIEGRPSAEPALTLDAVQAALPDDGTLLIHYALGESRSYAWTLTKSHARVHTLASRAELEGAALAYRRLVTARLEAPAGDTPVRRTARLRAARADARLAARRAGDLMLGPLAAVSTDAIRRVIVVPDGELHALPFAALTPPGSTVPLVERYDVTALPSSSVLRALASRTNSPGARSVAIVADPVFDVGDARVIGRSGATPATGRGDASVRGLAAALEVRGAGTALPRLAYTRLEARAIAGVAPLPPPAIALGFAATREWFIAAASARHGVIHLATHALVDPARPELSGVVLSLVNERGAALDGFLSLHRLHRLRLTADLVVLSACQTAVGMGAGGEGVMSLAREFMAAGVPRILASLWNVDDQATAELMRVFYEGHLGPERLAPAAALRRAQNWMRRQPRWADPYFWAAWTLHGVSS